MKELIRVRLQYASRQQCCKTTKWPLPFTFLPYILTYISNFYTKFTFCIRKLNYFYVMCNLPFKGNLPEDDHNGWPKHIASYTLYSTIIHISVYPPAGHISHNLHGV